MQRRSPQVTRRRVAAHACPECRRLWALRGVRTDAGAWVIRCEFCGWRDVRGGAEAAVRARRQQPAATPVGPSRGAVAPFTGTGTGTGPSSGPDAPADPVPHAPAGPADPAPRWSHGVLLYDEDSQLLDVLEDYLVTGWTAGGAGLVIATAEHRAALRTRLTARGLGGSLGGECLVELDAVATLQQFMRDGAPDPALFDRTVGSLIADHAAGTALRGFGEMVDVLWAAGNAVGALQLERLWSGLQQRVGFELLCAYATAHVDPEDRATLTGAHDRVVR